MMLLCTYFYIIVRMFVRCCLFIVNSLSTMVDSVLRSLYLGLYQSKDLYPCQLLYYLCSERLGSRIISTLVWVFLYLIYNVLIIFNFCLVQPLHKLLDFIYVRLFANFEELYPELALLLRQRRNFHFVVQFVATFYPGLNQTEFRRLVLYLWRVNNRNGWQHLHLIPSTRALDVLFGNALLLPGQKGLNGLVFIAKTFSELDDDELINTPLHRIAGLTEFERSLLVILRLQHFIENGFTQILTLDLTRRMDEGQTLLNNLDNLYTNLYNRVINTINNPFGRRPLPLLLPSGLEAFEDSSSSSSSSSSTSTSSSSASSFITAFSFSPLLSSVGSVFKTSPVLLAPAKKGSATTKSVVQTRTPSFVRKQEERIESTMTLMNPWPNTSDEIESAINELTTPEQGVSVDLRRDIGFWRNDRFDPFVEGMLEHTFNEIFPPRPLKNDDGEALVEWYNDIILLLRYDLDGFPKTPDTRENPSIKHFFKTLTTVHGRNYMMAMWDYLGFDDHIVSPFMDEFDGSERFDVEVRRRVKQNKEIEERNKRRARMFLKPLPTEEPGYKFTHAEARIVSRFIYDFFFLCLIGQLRFDLTSLRPDDNAYNDLLVIEDSLLRGLSKVTRPGLIEVNAKLVPRIYAGYDTEYTTQDFGKIQLLSYQLAIASRITVEIEHAEGLNLNTNLTATGYEYARQFKSEFTHLSNVAILAHSLHFVTESLRVNKWQSLINLLEHQSKLGVLFKGVHRTAQGSNTEYTLLDEFNASNIPLKYFNVLKVGETLSLECLVNRIHELGYPLCLDNVNRLEKLLTEPLNDDALKSAFLPDITNKNTKIFLLAHYTIADLSPLTDFHIYKHKFDLLYKSYTTLRSPVRFNLGANKSAYLYLRDTMMLLANGTSLKSLGDMMGCPKLDLPEGSISRMDLLLAKDPDLFEAYAMRDAEISLLYGLYIETFNAKNVDGHMWIPTTVASMSKNKVLAYWLENQMPNVNVLNEYSVGNINKLLTPHGIQTTENFAVAMPLFTGSYRGGRNESFSYGFDLENEWYDYDLTSAYTTALALAGEPDYESLQIIPSSYTPDDLKAFINSEQLFNSYSTFHVDFEFPADVIYPNLPVHLDKTLTVYPSAGTSYTNGLSLKVALDNGCNVSHIHSGSIVPFKRNPWVVYDEDRRQCGIRYDVDRELDALSWNRADEAMHRISTLHFDNHPPSIFTGLPYFSVIKHLQDERRKHPKGTLENLFFKLMGNAIYGQVAVGMANKRAFSSREGRMTTIGAGALTNPIMVSFVTDFLRATLSELMNEVHKNGGRLISCTTDGFITDLANLDTDDDFGRGPLARYFSLSRGLLSGDSRILELKHHERGVASWAVRGQLSMQPGGHLKAMTGFQSKYFTMDFLQNMVLKALNTKTLEITFMQRSLRSGKDVYEKGGAVTPKLEEKTFRLVSDGRRQLPTDVDFDIVDLPRSVLKASTQTDPLAAAEYRKTKGYLLQSKPWDHAETCKSAISTFKLGRDQYAKNTQYPIKGARYKDFKQLAVNMFTRGVLQGTLIDSATDKAMENPFKRYKHLVNFLHDLGINTNTKAIANNKRSVRPFLANCVPRVPETEAFLQGAQSELMHRYGIKMDLDQFFMT